eukprot:Plantae.Rhodophyta-Rhodochaete_pulchella.ctg2484.p1 GENE.Plantae.Rhodophyta-Rhodochaete_pulchella.ctg2484~~Plantae.Rhodophyta-Rhodochaete_pulchella.ctg2484.p1  ORF type:complete len:318 (-),score=31.41 Plantae.Rhodophyta-Rhodochaete_pulchella.ctg2484:139-993(-)
MPFGVVTMTLTCAICFACVQASPLQSSQIKLQSLKGEFEEAVSPTECRRSLVECADQFERCREASSLEDCCPLFECVPFDCVVLLSGEEDAQSFRERCGSSSCFPFYARVILAGGQTKSMEELSVGDEVVVGGDGSTSPVHFFGHKDLSSRTRFVQLDHGEGSLVLSPGHFVYVDGALKRATDVKVGDTLEVFGFDGNVTTSKVHGVDVVYGSGLYNPHTLSGDLIVDGVKTSCYTSAVHPRLAHYLLAPLRAAYLMGFRAPKFLWDGAPIWLTTRVPRATLLN